VQEVRLEFSSGGLSLEGVLALSQGTGPFPAVIVCHPHPLYGGSMDNNVVNGICRKLPQAQAHPDSECRRGDEAEQEECKAVK